MKYRKECWLIKIFVINFILASGVAIAGEVDPAALRSNLWPKISFKGEICRKSGKCDHGENVLAKHNYCQLQFAGQEKNGNKFYSCTRMLSVALKQETFLGSVKIIKTINKENQASYLIEARIKGPNNQHKFWKSQEIKNDEERFQQSIELKNFDQFALSSKLTLELVQE